MARRTKEEALATRNALLDAAERVFQARGVSRTSLAEIAQAAGVTRGALYWHFKDKADLFHAMMQRVMLPLETGMAQVAAGSTDDSDSQGDAIASLRDYLCAGLHQVEHDEQTRRVLQIAILMVEHTDDLHTLRMQHAQDIGVHRQHMARTLQRASQQRGIALPAAPDTLAVGLQALLHGLVEKWMLDSSFDLQTTGQQCIDVYLRGIGLPPAA